MLTCVLQISCRCRCSLVLVYNETVNYHVFISIVRQDKQSLNSPVLYRSSSIWNVTLQKLKWKTSKMWNRNNEIFKSRLIYPASTPSKLPHIFCDTDNVWLNPMRKTHGFALHRNIHTMASCTTTQRRRWVSSIRSQENMLWFFFGNFLYNECICKLCLDNEFHISHIHISIELKMSRQSIQELR